MILNMILYNYFCIVARTDQVFTGFCLLTCIPNNNNNNNLMIGSLGASLVINYGFVVDSEKMNILM